MSGNPLYTEVVDEEDPKVIKELIDLIKKLGGIEQLERQLNLDGNASKTAEAKPTTQPLISKALYEKVISSSASGRSFLPRNRYTFGSQRNATKTIADTSSEVASKPALKPNKYSSVIRNSRPGPQSGGGIERLADRQPDGGNGQERPQYVTIRRPMIPTNQRKDSVVEVDADDDDEEAVTPKRESSVAAVSTGQPKYVNIQRRRGSTTENPLTVDEDDDDTDEVVAAEQPFKSRYSTLNRPHGSTPIESAEGDEVTPSGLG